MFGWRRRSEGFEWREYVRTTVLVRRADRQRRVDDARMAALSKVKEQKDRGVEAGKAGLNAAGSAAGRAASVAGHGALAAGAVAWRGLTAAGGKALSGAGAVACKIPMPKLAVRLLGAGNGKRIRDMIPDVAWRSPISLKHAGYAVGALGAIFVIGPMLNGAVPSVPSGLTTGSIRTAERVSAAAPVRAVVSSESSGGINGRGTAISGHLLRVGSDVVRLAGIEAPEATQPCFKADGRKWSCSASATSALSRLVRGKRISCDVSGTDDAGRKLATCRGGDTDIAAELVRGGHVFAESGFFASYTSDEDAARSAKAGIWQSENVRPAEWRKRSWEDAKRVAPDGCPIKGYVRAASRFYAMPWSHDYDARSVRSFKGERWFCSEDEARAAGFKLASRS